jgi:hypothetical protein
MAVTSANYASIVAACRRALANGTNLTGNEIRLVVDVVQAAANTLDSKGVAAVAALEAELVTQMAIWDAAKGAATTSEYAAALAALDPLRTAATAAAAASVTDVAADDKRDGRAA